MKARYYHRSLKQWLGVGCLALAVVLAVACSEEVAIVDVQQPLPEGMGCIRVTICTPENNPALTRAVNVNPWETPDHDWEKLQSFRIFICDADNKVVQIITGSADDMKNTSTSQTESFYQSAELTSQPLGAGTYKIYATANYADGYTVGNTIDLDKTVKFANGYSETNIPMTGKLTNTDGSIKEVTVTNGHRTDAGTITVWRIMGKMQFDFTNESASKIRIKGIEVEPVNQASSTGPGIYLFSKDDLTSTANLVPMFPSGASKQGVSATWPLNTTALQTAAKVSMSGVFAATELTWGSKLVTTDGLITTYDNIYTLQQFETTENVTGRDNDAVISFKVTPKPGMTFTPKNLSFKACRGGTDGGNFDVEVICNGITTTLATGERPRRFNGDNGNNGNHEPPFMTNYSYTLGGTPTSGDYIVKIYLYNLNQRAFGFSDVAITGDVTNNTGSDLQEALTLPIGARTDVGIVKYEPSSPLELNATNGTGSLFFYVNETDATYTTTDNQLSVRFKIQRQNGSGWYDDEIRYGLTTNHDGNSGGFNVIRRNDWIHIPVHLRDWTFRVEPLAFVPIAGYPAVTLSSDALTTTFSTGGYIVLQPFAQKNNDGIWRDFSDPEVNFVSLSWKNSDGTNVSGTGKIFESPLAYDPVTKYITGVLNNNLAAGTYMTTVTVNAKLSGYDYNFTFNVILQVTTN